MRDQVMNFIKGHWQLIVITTLVFLCWKTSAVVPLKILVVFMHELSHGLAGVLTGGSIESITISPYQGGLATIRGGNFFAIASAGYLGSLLIGAGLLLVALRTDADRIVLAICGGVMLLVTALYIRDDFALSFCVATGVVMLLIARYLGHAVNDMVLRVIGLTSLLYVPYDIFDDTIARSGLRSDAYILAERYGGPTMFWGGLWLFISVVVIRLCLKYGIGENSNIRFRKTPPNPLDQA